MLTLPWIGIALMGAGIFLVGLVAAAIIRAVQDARAARDFARELEIVEAQGLDPLPARAPHRPLLPAAAGQLASGPRFLPRTPGPAETTATDLGSWRTDHERTERLPDRATIARHAEFVEWEQQQAARINGAWAWFRATFGPEDGPEMIGR